METHARSTLVQGHHLPSTGWDPKKKVPCSVCPKWIAAAGLSRHVKTHEVPQVSHHKRYTRSKIGQVNYHSHHNRPGGLAIPTLPAKEGHSTSKRVLQDLQQRPLPPPLNAPLSKGLPLNVKGLRDQARTYFQQSTDFEKRY
jgi:hypothetical protein